MPYICFTPFNVPEKLWRQIYPPPCSHNRCRLRRYVSQPLPWYHTLKHLYQPVGRQYNRIEGSDVPETSFPLFRLKSTSTLAMPPANSMRASSQWRAGKHTQYYCGLSAATTLIVQHGAATCDANTQQSVRSEDNVSYQLDDNGIIAVHRSWPPTNLLLNSKGLHEEACDAFRSTTAFKV